MHRGWTNCLFVDLVNGITRSDLLSDLNHKLMRFLIEHQLNKMLGPNGCGLRSRFFGVQILSS